MSAWCAECCRADNARRRSDPATVEYHRRFWKRWKYGLEQHEFDAMLEAQDGRCAVCGERPEKALHIDHNHETGVVRGLLCDLCNRGIGYFKDQPERLRKAASYIEEGG